MDGVLPSAPAANGAAGAAAHSTSTASSAAKRSAQDFEAVFLGQMTKMMMETVTTYGPFVGGHGEEMFRGLLAEKLGGALAARGGIGLAPAVMTQILALQQAATPTPPSMSEGAADAR